MPVEGQGLGPGDQIASQGDDFEPDPVGPVVVERQVTQAGVLEAADTVLGAGALAVAHFEDRSVQPVPRVLVAKQVIRQPLWSVSRSWAPGWGRSRRAMTRIPRGHSWGPYLAGERVGLTGVGIQAVSSATCAPSRGAPSLSSAATQACSGIVSIAAWTGP